MTPLEALAEGRLAEAVSLQEEIIRAGTTTASARLLLVELLALAGRLRDAWDALKVVHSDEESWPESRQAFRQVLKAEHRRSGLLRRPKLLNPIPRHAKCRWKSMLAVREGNQRLASGWVDRADRHSPEIQGHLDGQEFEGLRDTDDRFGSVLEVFLGGEYLWVPFEQLRDIRLSPAIGVLDTAYRPARLRLRSGEEWAVTLPLLYPGSHLAEEHFACGKESDWHSESDGPLCGMGARVLMVGEDEVLLSECRQIEIRPMR